MNIFLTHTGSKQKEEFTPRTGGKVSMYSCGPTVYNYPHIGNYRAYLFCDALSRMFRYFGYQVRHVMNITDVDDKTIRDSQKEGVALRKFTKQYEDAFHEDLASLNIALDSHPKATEHIAEMVALIEKLLAHGNAYRGEDGSIYFSIDSFPSYGSLSGIALANLKRDASGRMKHDEYDKESVNDFALWKAWTPDDGDVFWETSIGKGRPGWHIECSAMSMKYLGEQFDIHCGGIDLVFPHHENEIAQSECATQMHPFVSYWLHNEWLLVDGKKMSKSLGNFFTLRDVVARGYEPLTFRFFCLSTSYRQVLNFTWEALDAAKNGLSHLRHDLVLLRERARGTSDEMTASAAWCDRVAHAKQEIDDALADDLSIPHAFGTLFDLIREVHANGTNLSSADYRLVVEYIERLDTVFGLGLCEAGIIHDPDILALVQKRDDARKQKDYKAADAIRSELYERGYVIEDTDQGSRVVNRVN